MSPAEPANMNAMEPLVLLENATLRFDGRELLSDLEFGLREGETWHVTGAPGSGKSLFLEVVLGRHVLARGRRSYPAFVSRHPDARIGIPPRWAIRLVSNEVQRRVAAQQASFHQARWHADWILPLSVRAFLEPRQVFGILPYEVVEQLPTPADYEEQKRSLLERLDLAGFEERRVGQLSNGELRKLLLVAAQLAAPELLLLDDPLGGLHALARASVAEVIQEYRASGRRLLLATPVDDELASLATHRLTLDSGKIVRAGATGSEPSSALDFGAPLSLRLPAPLETRHPDSSSSATIVRCRNVRVRASTATLLADLDWDIGAGERWLVTGQNGAGKSTLLSLLAGDHPQAYVNDVEIFGKRLGVSTTLWERRQRLGFVAPELHWHYPGEWSALELVLSGIARTIGVQAEPSERERTTALAWLDAVGIEPHQRAMPFAALSEGEQRMVLFARSVIGEPELLLLDEPTQGLDRGKRERLFAVLDALAAERGLTFVLVTHHPDERPRSMTHHLELAGGRVVRAGPLPPGDPLERASRETGSDARKW